MNTVTLKRNAYTIKLKFEECEHVNFRKCFIRGEKLGDNMERNGRILAPNELSLTFWFPNYGTKFHENFKNRLIISEDVVKSPRGCF